MLVHLTEIDVKGFQFTTVAKDRNVYRSSYDVDAVADISTEDAEYVVRAIGQIAQLTAGLQAVLFRMTKAEQLEKDHAAELAAATAATETADAPKTEATTA